MNTFFRLFAILIEWPWLALAPAAAFYAVGRRRQSRAAVMAAASWAIYALYELAMRARLLCSGECNIRVDLLLIYPALAIFSVVAAFAAIARGGRTA